jgi:Cu/Ag efflux pump CusA
VWGLLAVSLVLVITLLIIWDRSLNLGTALYVAYVPFELVVGLWLLIKSARPASMAAVSAGGLALTNRLFRWD